MGLSRVKVPDSLVTIDEDISRMNSGIEILSKYHQKESGIKAMKKGLAIYTFEELEQKAAEIDYMPIYNDVQKLWKKRESLKSEKEKAKLVIDELIPWKSLDIPISYLNDIDKAVLFTGTIPKSLKDMLAEELKDYETTHCEVVGEDKDNLYIIVMSHGDEADKTLESLRNVSFSKINMTSEQTPSEEIRLLEEKILSLEKEMSDKDDELVSKVSKLSELEVTYEYLNNKKLRVVAAENFLVTDQVDVIKGYVPTEKLEAFDKKVMETLGNTYYLETKDAEKESRDVPILLDNGGFVKPFESLTEMYALPRYNEIDPTPLLAPFYLIFFGMMAADVGYGIVMLLATFIILKTFNLSEKTKTFIKFFYYLSFSVLIWGFLYGSFFGGIVPLTGLFEPATDYNTLLILSIIFGLIHIYFGLALKAYINIRDKKYMDALFDVGFWYVALTGAIVYLLNMIIDMPEVVKTVSLWVMIGGMAGIVLTGGRDASGVVGKFGGGLYSLYGITGYVGDFVSYSRLMALGLAGGFIAGAVNMMAGMIVGSGPIGFVAAIVIFIFGQTFNLGLSFLGAYVHSIRLIFVEFFSKFYEGGGKKFRDFRSKPKYINLR
jgi:V/A-type H+-transporting ATPase subunit I